MAKSKLRTGPKRRDDYPIVPGSFADRAMRMVDSLDMSDTEASLKAGLTASYVREHYRFPNQHPRIDCVEALARVFGVTPEWLAFGGRARASASKSAAAGLTRDQALLLREGMVTMVMAAGGKRFAVEPAVRDLLASVGIPSPLRAPRPRTGPASPVVKPQPRPAR